MVRGVRFDDVRHLRRALPHHRRLGQAGQSAAERVLIGVNEEAATALSDFDGV